jgi:hypothetical protein
MVKSFSGFLFIMLAVFGHRPAQAQDAYSRAMERGFGVSQSFSDWRASRGLSGMERGSAISGGSRGDIWSRATERGFGVSSRFNEWCRSNPPTINSHPADGTSIARYAGCVLQAGLQSLPDCAIGTVGCVTSKNIPGCLAGANSCANSFTNHFNECIGAK